MSYLSLDAFCREQGWDGHAAVPPNYAVVPCAVEECNDVHCPGWKVVNDQEGFVGRASVCAWCPDARERTREAIERGQLVTHGICARCAEGIR